MSFLKAEWRKLIMVNYAIEPEILKPFVPFGTELDYWNGKCYVSIVGFMFLNTRVLGLKIPFHTNFEEVNLRFYVKRKEGENWKRGVVFVKEIVPKHAITFIANTFYKENYITLQMSHKWKTLGGQLSIEYSWRTKNMVNSLSVVAKRDSEQILENSEAEFITEHYWGYAKNNKAKTNEYEVRHPKWLQYQVNDSKIDIDFEENYGREFAFLSERNPDSIFLAEGSEISVEGKSVINQS